jgi:hypothetical protein
LCTGIHLTKTNAGSKHTNAEEMEERREKHSLVGGRGDEGKHIVLVCQQRRGLLGAGLPELCHSPGEEEEEEEEEETER